jgi:exopolyphosphatase/guanosine-5'-triphosphate,3'-diphosphate pyrophosphatase
MKTIVLIVVSFFASVALAQPCQVRLGALDIGSGSTKAYAAVVDRCQKRIVETLLDEKVAIAFSEALAKSGKGEIPAETITEAAAKISTLVKAIRAKNVERVSAVATSAFRVAKNGASAASDIAGLADVPIKILTQEEEAEVGATSAFSRIQVPASERRQLIVWDIGGGSMQMWAREKKAIHLFKGDLASVSLKNIIIRDVQKKDPQTTTSPNPIGKDAAKAAQIAADHARSNVPPFFRNVARNARWVGIGGVLALSVQKQVRTQVKAHESRFTRKELKRTLEQRATLTDQSIGGDFASTEISNLALVLGYMTALGIRGVETTEASLAQGWLLSDMNADH